MSSQDAGDDKPTPPPDPPPAPYPTPDIRDLREGEVFRLGFWRSDGRPNVDLEFAGYSLSATNDLLRTQGAARFGNLGDRGPVGAPPDLERLELSDVVMGSAVFYFAPALNSDLRLRVDPKPRVAEVVEDIVRLVKASSGGDVLAAAQQVHPRVAARYVDLLDVIASSDLCTDWLGLESLHAELEPAEARESLDQLEVTDELSRRSIHIAGILYEANARSRGFKLVREDDAAIIAGKFREDLVERVGQLWNQTVIASIDVTTETLKRTGTERLRYTLTELEPVGQPRQA